MARRAKSTVHADPLPRGYHEGTCDIRPRFPGYCPAATRRRTSPHLGVITPRRVSHKARTASPRDFVRAHGMWGSRRLAPPVMNPQTRAQKACWNDADRLRKLAPMVVSAPWLAATRTAFRRDSGMESVTPARELAWKSWLN